jgi:P-type conjugative transfer protein TrbG
VTKTRPQTAAPWDAPLSLALQSARRWRRNSAVCAVLLVPSFIGACSKAAPAARSPAPSFLQASPIVEGGMATEDPQGLDVLVSDTTGAGNQTANPVRDSDSGLEFAGALEDEASKAQAIATRRASTPASPETPPSTPTAVIAHANAVASQAPESDGFLNAVMTYTFLPGAIFKVYAAPNNVTDLVLEPGEQLMGEPAAGDTLRWRLGVGTSSVAGVPQKHIFIKPTRAGLTTNLTINTDRRTYFLKLESLESDFMVAVQWSYPQSQALAPLATAPAAARASSAPAATPTPADVSALNFDYAIETAAGKPRWKPQVVYDDGQKTFIRFDASILHGESPALYVIERGEMQIVNYRVKKNLYVVDRIFEFAELRLGQEDQDIVRLRNRRAPRPKVQRSPSSTGRTPSAARPGTPR